MSGFGTAVEHVGGLMLWSFLPAMIARFVLSTYYRFAYGVAPLQPRPGSAAYRRDYARAFTAVVCLYFAYCIANYALHLKPSHYSVIGVHRQSIDAKLKTHFRHAMVHMHPDKNPDADPTVFLQMKYIYEVLTNDETRHAYDCYGPEVIRHVQMSSTNAASATTLQDFFSQALMDWVGFYAVTAVMFLITSFRSSWSRLFWRGLALLACAAVDIYVLMRPVRFGAVRAEPGGIFGIALSLWNGIPTFVKLSLMRQIYMYGSMATTQVAGLFERPPEREEIAERVRYIEQLGRGALTKETAFSLIHVMEPVRENEEMRDLLRNKMGKLAAEIQLFDMLDANDRTRLNAIKRTQ